MTRRVGRWVAIGGGTSLAILGLLVLGAYGAVKTEAGRAWIARAAAAALSEPGRIEVSLERLEGRLPQEIRLSGFSIRDRRGRWLKASAVEADWRPLALFSGKLHISELRVADLTVARPPAAAEGQAEEAVRGFPSLPFGVAIDRLSIENVTLDAAVLGQPASFSITGEAASGGADRLTSSLVIERTDDTVGRAEVAAVYVPLGDRLTLDVAVNEPAGGLVARALGLPELPAVSASLSGDGPLANWRGDATVSFEDLGSAAAQVALERQDGMRVRIQGSALSARPAERLPWRLLAGDLDFDVLGQWTANQVLAIERAQLVGPAIRLNLEGALALADRTLDVRATAGFTDPAVAEVLAAGAAADGVDLEASAKGPLLRPTISGTASLRRLTAPGIDARRAAARFTFVPERPLDQGPAKGAVAVNGEVEDLTYRDLADLAPLLGRRFAWRLAGTLDLGKGTLDANTLFVRAGANEVAGTGAFGLDGGTANADVRISLGDLTGLSPLLGIGVQGRADIAAQMESTGFGEVLTAKLDGTLEEVRLANAVAGALFAGRAAVAADLALRPDGVLTLANAEIETPAARLAGEMALTGGYERIDAGYGLTVADTSVLSGPLGIRIAGRGDVRGRAEGGVRDPELKGQVTMTEARIEGLEMGRIDLTYSAKTLSKDPRGRLALSAAPQTGRLEASADYTFVDPELRFTGLRLRSGDTAAEGTLTVPTDGAFLRGSLNIEAKSLSPWLALAGLEGSGAATAELRLSGDGRRQAAELKADLTNPVWRLDDKQALRAKTAKVTLRTVDLKESAAGRAVVEATAVALDELRLDSLSLSAEGDRSKAAVRLQTVGAFRGPLALNATGSLSLEPDAFSLDLETAEGRALGNALKLRDPAKVTYRPDTVDLSRLDLDFGPARIAAAARIDPERVFGELTVGGLPIASLDPIWPMGGTAGTVGIAIAVDGPRVNPSGEARLEVAGLKVEPTDGLPPLDLVVSGDWRDRRLKLAGQLTGMAERAAELSADLPLGLDADRLALTMPPAEPLSGRLSWQGEIGSVWPFVPLDTHRLSGETEIAAALAGSVAKPEVSGSLRLANGAYESLDAGTILKDVDLALAFEAGRVILSRFTATDGAKGRLSARGRLTVDSNLNYPFELEADATEFTLVRRDDVTAVSDGRLSFEGSLERASLTGQLETRAIEVRIVDRLPAEVAILDVVETGASEKVKNLREEEEKNGAGPDVALDVAVAIPRRAFVRGRGLDSEWSGSLKATGTARQPIVTGDLTLVRGQLSVLTRSFRLVSGDVRFPGGTNIVPELDVRAESKAQDLTVTARVRGPATNPSISLTSSPERPQDEIVSRILFEKGTAQLSALEAAQLAAAAAELTGSDGGLSAFDFARGLLGVDVLRFETAGPGKSGGPGVEAGKYVTEDVYLGVKKGIADESGTVGVEVELTPNISVESETGTTGESDIGIKFKWDY